MAQEDIYPLIYKLFLLFKLNSFSYPPEPSSYLDHI